MKLFLTRHKNENPSQMQSTRRTTVVLIKENNFTNLGIMLIIATELRSKISKF